MYAARDCVWINQMLLLTASSGHCDNIKLVWWLSRAPGPWHVTMCHHVRSPPLSARMTCPCYAPLPTSQSITSHTNMKYSQSIWILRYFTSSLMTILHSRLPGLRWCWCCHGAAASPRQTAATTSSTRPPTTSSTRPGRPRSWRAPWTASPCQQVSGRGHS